MLLFEVLSCFKMIVLSIKHKCGFYLICLLKNRTVVLAIEESRRDTNAPLCLLSSAFSLSSSRIPCSTTEA